MRTVREFAQNNKEEKLRGLGMGIRKATIGCEEKHRRRFAPLLAIMVLLCSLGISFPLQAMEPEEEKLTVRVGFFAIDGYHQQDEEGNKSGYGYDFLQMIAPYANVEYEYVGYDKSWEEMQQMLLDGEIDLVTSARKTPEREELFEFSKKSIGYNYTILTVRSDNTTYTIEDYATLNGIRVGLLKGNSRNESFDAYAKEHGFTYRPVYYEDASELQQALAGGKEVDALVSSSLRTLQNEKILDQFGWGEFYVITKKGNRTLMDRIDRAMSRLDSATPDWLIFLEDKYQNNSLNGKALFLTQEERRCLSQLNTEGKKLKVLIDPDLEPYSFFEDGVPKGIFVDLLAMSSQKAGFSYEILETASLKEYLEMVESGEPDLVFGATFDYNMAEKAGYYLTSPYYTATYARITRNNDNTKDDVTAIKATEGRLGDRYLSHHIKNDRIEFETFDECIQAVKSGKADCTYVFTYTASKFVGEDYTNSFAHEVIKDVSCPVAVAVKKDLGSSFFSVMDKMASSIDSEQRDAAINANTQYHVENSGFWYMVYNEPVAVILSVLALTSGIVILIIWFRARERKAERLHREKDARQKEALQAAYESANRANRAKSEFLSGISHDIRTPLNAIVGMVAIASAHRDDPARVSDCLTKITASSRHLLGLINEVLDMSRIESGKVTLTEEEFNLANLLDNLVTMVQPGMKAKKHELIVRIQSIAHEDVVGDSLRIQQAFVNIVGNAIKYTPEGGKIEIEVSELASKSPKVGVYRFVFKDNGIGMSKDYAKTIFEPFSREKDSRVDKIQGTGLGMAITKNIVQMMDGSIEVESEQGKGSVFTVLIRLKLQAKAYENVDEFVGLPVLVVDDDESICESTCLMLEEIGMDSEFVLSGQEAVTKISDAHVREEDFFAAIIDWMMPGMDGLATTKAIREAVGPDVPIIIFSAYDWSDIEEEARAAGVNAFISKPVFKSKLVHVFDELVHQEKPKEETDMLEGLQHMDFHEKHLLLVEDNELNREVACEILKMTGIQIDTAENGEEAVKCFEESKHDYYDLILMDIQMPVMNGYDASLNIRVMDRPDAKRVPIVAMTADAFAEDVEKALAAQMNEHLAKPLDIQKLAEVLTRWMPG